MISARELPHNGKPIAYEAARNRSRGHTSRCRHGFQGHDDSGGDNAFSVAAGVAVVGAQDEMHDAPVQFDADQSGNERVLNRHGFHEGNLAAYFGTHLRASPTKLGKYYARRSADDKTVPLFGFVSEQLKCAFPLQPESGNSVSVPNTTGQKHDFVFLNASRRMRGCSPRQLAGAIARSFYSESRGGVECDHAAVTPNSHLVGRSWMSNRGAVAAQSRICTRPARPNLLKNFPRNRAGALGRFRSSLRLPSHDDWKHRMEVFSGEQNLFAKRASHV